MGAVDETARGGDLRKRLVRRQHWTLCPNSPTLHEVSVWRQATAALELHREVACAQSRDNRQILPKDPLAKVLLKICVNGSNLR